jgi:drug/metabolite transporter (DMT)-like permease
MLPFLLAGAMVELYLNKDFDIKDVITWSTIKTLLFLGVTGNMMSLGYIWSAEYTIMSHASIFNSLGGVVIVIARLATKRYVHHLEIAGTAIAVAGCFVTLMDSSAEKVNNEN